MRVSLLLVLVVIVCSALPTMGQLGSIDHFRVKKAANHLAEKILSSQKTLKCIHCNPKDKKCLRDCEHAPSARRLIRSRRPVVKKPDDVDLRDVRVKRDHHVEPDHDYSGYHGYGPHSRGNNDDQGDQGGQYPQQGYDSDPYSYGYGYNAPYSSDG